MPIFLRHGDMAVSKRADTDDFLCLPFLWMLFLPDSYRFARILATMSRPVPSASSMAMISSSSAFS